MTAMGKEHSPLIEVLKRELRTRGYEEVEPNPNGGGVWSHPGWHGSTDHITEAIQDCFQREAESGHGIGTRQPPDVPPAEVERLRGIERAAREFMERSDVAPMHDTPSRAGLRKALEVA